MLRQVPCACSRALTPGAVGNIFSGAYSLY
jgi:hypothetical protein